MSDYRELLLESFEVVVASASPDTCMQGYIPAPHMNGKTYVIGAGKAAAKMAATFEKLYKHPIEEGVVVTRYGHAVSTDKIEVLEASHPIPDRAGIEAAKKIIAISEKATEQDLVVCLLSGGGSALLSYPCDGITLKENKYINEQLLKSGAPISQMNAVRKHLNKTFGGRLAKAVYPAKLITLSISDVPQDDPSVIASGPTVGDPSTLDDVISILEMYKIEVSDNVLNILKDPTNETPFPTDSVFKNTEYRLIATPQKSLDSAAEFFESKGLKPYVLSADMEGDTNECADFHAFLAKQIVRKNQPFEKGCVIISGGETTVKVTGTGDGGPNTQFMLKTALSLNGMDGVYAIACDTDGIDGSMDNAGAIINGDTLDKAKSQGVCPKTFLANNNSYNFFRTIDDLVVCGPTHTNVNDYRAIIVAGE